MGLLSDDDEPGPAGGLFAETSRVELLRPIAIEGELVISCLSFLPLSVVVIVAAAFMRSLLNGAACGYAETYCVSANGIPVSPIGFGVAPSRLNRNPGAGTLASKPWVAVTGYSLATGWDNPRLYEIIANGGLPYVVDL